jgi:hypothetical protein
VHKVKSSPGSLGLSATSQQYFSLGTNQPPATSQQYFSLRTNQHQPSATSQPNRLRERDGCLQLVIYIMPGDFERSKTRISDLAGRQAALCYL